MKTNFNVKAEEAILMLQNENDVLDTEEMRELRMHDLRRAAILGTVYSQESRIEYEDQIGRINTLNSRVLGVTDRNVIVHSHKLIPIHRVSRVVV